MVAEGGAVELLHPLTVAASAAEAELPLRLLRNQLLNRVMVVEEAG